MALLKCPDCGKMVSSRVDNCPECGCPATFFESEIVKENKTNVTVVNNEYKKFSFRDSYIKYPDNAEMYAGLFGDYLKIGFDKYKILRDIYKRLGDADSVANKFSREAQKLINEQVEEVLKNLYNNGLAMTREQFKQKYDNVYPMEYELFMDPFMNEYNNILGKQAQMRHDRAVSYSNRMRWSGGGFGMSGAIKGALQAGVLNAGTSVISGLGNAVVSSFNEGSIEKRKEKLFEDERIMNATCEGIIICMTSLFLAYTDELYDIGKLGNKISLDIETANAKFEATMAYEKNKEKLFAAIVECLSLYPASRTFYEAIEMELEECPDWKEFKKYWHLDFLYQENERAFLKTSAKLDNRSGTLKLYQDVLIFDGEDSRYSKKIPIGSINEVTKEEKYFQLSLKGKFLLLLLETPMDEVWVEAINKALCGKYEKVDVKNVSMMLAEKEDAIKNKAIIVKEYIAKNYTCENKASAISYYRDQIGCSLSEARMAVNAILENTAKTSSIHTYPGTEELESGVFRGERVILWKGGPSMEGYTILTTKELIEIDIKKNKENVYDIYKISRMKAGLFGAAISFKYVGSFMEKCVSSSGTDAAEFINKITNMQKGSFN